MYRVFAKIEKYNARDIAYMGREISESQNIFIGMKVHNSLPEKFSVRAKTNKITFFCIIVSLTYNICICTYILYISTNLRVILYKSSRIHVRMNHFEIKIIINPHVLQQNHKSSYFFYSFFLFHLNDNL